MQRMCRRCGGAGSVVSGWAEDTHNPMPAYCSACGGTGWVEDKSWRPVGGKGSNGALVAGGGVDNRTWLVGMAVIHGFLHLALFFPDIKLHDITLLGFVAVVVLSFATVGLTLRLFPNHTLLVPMLWIGSFWVRVWVWAQAPA